MEQYHSILPIMRAKGADTVPCLFFYKYDGSNLRWEWSPKTGWNKYGTRRHLFDVSDPLFGPAIEMFKDQLGAEIVKQVKTIHPRIERITAYTEFFGPSSFAGQHVIDEPHELRLFDVWLFKKGFIDPWKFMELFGHLPQCAEVVHEGILSWELIEAVKKGKFPVDEGVVVKGIGFMGKIKTEAYLTKLRAKFADRWEEYV